MSIALPLPEPYSPPDNRADLGRAIAELTDRLPERIQSLAWLAFNYRWSWMLDGPELFRTIDAHIWERSGNNPRAVIEVASPRRLQEIGRDDAFVARVQAVTAAV